MVFTQEQLADFRRCIDNPTYFIENFVMVQHPLGRSKFILHPYHHRTISNFVGHRFNIQVQGRMLGLTTLGAALLLWKALFHNDQMIAVVSATQNGAKEIMNILRGMYEDLPQHLSARVTEYNKMSMRFANGSRILAGGMSSTFTRGLAVNVLYCDDFAFAPPTVQAEFLDSVWPSLAYGNASVFIASAPTSIKDRFAMLWVEANSNPACNWHAEKITWRDHPERAQRDSDWAAGMKRALGAEVFAREHECYF